MSVAMELGQFALGLLLLVLGADSFVRGASGLAIRFGISPFVVGLVLVGLGTSEPELSVNLTAALAGRYEMAIGNVGGSIIASIGLIPGGLGFVSPLAVLSGLLSIQARRGIWFGVGWW